MCAKDVIYFYIYYYLLFVECGFNCLCLSLNPFPACYDFCSSALSSAYVLRWPFFKQKGPRLDCSFGQTAPKV